MVLNFRRRIRRLFPSRSLRLIAGMMSQYARYCNRLPNRFKVHAAPFVEEVPDDEQVPEAEQDVAPGNVPIVEFPESSDSEPDVDEPVNERLTIVGEGGLYVSFSPELANLANSLAPIILQAMSDYHHHP